MFCSTRASNDLWPKHYIRKDIACSATLLQREGNSIVNHELFNENILSLEEFYPDFTDINFSKQKIKNGVSISLLSSLRPVSIVEAPAWLKRVLKILVFANSTRKGYFLVDDIDAQLNLAQSIWLYKELCRVALRRKIQLFVSTNNKLLTSVFEQIAKECHLSYSILDMEHHNLNIEIDETTN